MIADAIASAPPPASPKRPGILDVQGCSGCGQPERQKVLTPFGVRKKTYRLKLTRVPGVAGLNATHPRSAPKERRFAVYAKLCKDCRTLSRGTPLTAAEMAALDPRPAAAVA